MHLKRIVFKCILFTFYPVSGATKIESHPDKHL